MNWSMNKMLVNFFKIQESFHGIHKVQINPDIFILLVHSGYIKEQQGICRKPL